MEAILISTSLIQLAHSSLPNWRINPLPLLPLHEARGRRGAGC